MANVSMIIIANILLCTISQSLQLPSASKDEISSLQEKLQEERAKREDLENGLEKMTSIVYELLKSVNKLTKEYVSKEDIELIKKGLSQNEEKLKEIAGKQNDANVFDNKLSNVYETIRDSKESVTAVVEDALDTMNKKFEDLKTNMMEKLESKVKRSNDVGKFVSEESFEVVARDVEKLKKLPETLTSQMDQSYSKLSKGMSKSTITRDEFARFQLSVARDTSQLRVSVQQL